MSKFIKLTTDGQSIVVNSELVFLVSQCENGCRIETATGRSIVVSQSLEAVQQAISPAKKHNSSWADAYPVNKATAMQEDIPLCPVTKAKPSAIAQQRYDEFLAARIGRQGR